MKKSLYVSSTAFSSRKIERDCHGTSLGASSPVFSVEVVSVDMDCGCGHGEVGVGGHRSHSELTYLDGVRQREINPTHRRKLIPQLN